MFTDLNRRVNRLEDFVYSIDDLDDEEFFDEDEDLDFDEMDKDELLEFIDDNDLEIKAAKKKPLKKLRKLVAEVWEEDDDLDD